MAAAEPRLGVFVSYSHADDPAWLKRVQVHLEPLVREGRVELWDDTRIKSGERWREEIRGALVRAKVAVLLISADFYASDFIADKELPRLLEAERERGLVILGLHIDHSRFDRDRVLSEYQTINTPDQPIEGLSKAQQEKVFDDLARRIEELLDPRSPRPAASPSARSERPVLGRLHDLAARRSHGVSGAMIALVLLAIVGALALAVGLAGDRITAIGSNVGDVENSTVIIGPAPQEAKP
jgi:TIR domain